MAKTKSTKKAKDSIVKLPKNLQEMAAIVAEARKTKKIKITKRGRLDVFQVDTRGLKVDRT